MTVEQSDIDSNRLGAITIGAYNSVARSLTARLIDKLNADPLASLIVGNGVKSEIAKEIVRLYAYEVFLSGQDLDYTPEDQAHARELTRACIQEALSEALASDIILESSAAEFFITMEGQSTLTEILGYQPKRPPTIPVDDSKDQGGGGEEKSNDLFKSPPIDPLVIDLDKDGVELTALNASPTYFDMNGDGFAEQTGWVASDDGLLVLDRNTNGRIDDINELFGDTDGHANGYSRLSELDTDHNGAIDANDAQFGELLIWRDINQDGSSSTNELGTLTQWGIVSLSLTPDDQSPNVLSGFNGEHRLILEGDVTFADGSHSVMQDLFLNRNSISSYALLAPGFVYNPDALDLPVLWGSGTVASTWVVLTQNAVLRANAFGLLDMLAAGNVDEFIVSFEDFVLAWAGVEGVPTGGRGADVNGQHLAFLEAMHGAPFQIWDGDAETWNPNPNALTGQQVEEQYAAYVDQLAGRFIAQSALSSALLSTTISQAAAVLADHPFTDLRVLFEDHNPADRELRGNYVEALMRLNDQVMLGHLTAGAAATVAKVLRIDLSGDGVDPDEVLLLALNSSGLATASFGVAVVTAIYGDTHHILGGSSGADALTAGLGATFLIGGSGADVLTGGSGGSGGNIFLGDYFLGGMGNDTLVGGSATDVYFVARGDGNDTIIDSTSSLDDQIVFMGLLADDVSFSQSSGQDLIITISTSQVMTITDQFAGGDQINSVRFADGTVLNTIDIANKSVADQKSSGVVLGSRYVAETYFHSLGDGSYTIVEAGGDQLTFINLIASDLEFSTNTAQDLLITLSNGETITILKQFFGNDWQLGYIQFVQQDPLGFQYIQDSLDGNAIKLKLIVDSRDATFSGTSGDDHLLGGSTNDVLYGIDGHDTLTGGTGEDVLFGGAGNDTLDGGSGTDWMYGGVGDDTYFVNVTTETVFERDVLNEGNDTVRSTVVWTLGVNFENLVLGGTTNFNGTGNVGDNSLTGNTGVNSLFGLEGADQLFGGQGNDYLFGGDGNDILNGGAGQDWMYSGIGDDTYVIESASDWVGEGSNAGRDTIQSAVTWTLANNFEDLILTGSAIISGTGNYVDNSLTGNSLSNTLFGLDGNDALFGGGGNDQLFGDSGNDTLNGGPGIDTMTGGAGNDIYITDSNSDAVVELAGEGVDLVQSASTRTLGSNVEDLTLTGVSNINGTGNVVSNFLLGNVGDNKLFGLDGNDSLRGGAGNDTLEGGNGADRFIFSASGDGTDRITDFNELNGGGEEGDLFVFEGILVGAFSYRGTSAFTGGSDNTEARISGAQLLVDGNGDGTADITINLTGLTGASQLAASDFLFT